MEIAQDKKYHIIAEYLRNLGFSAEAIALYYTLAKNGPQSVFQAAKLSSVERTKIYRIIDELMQRGIIVELVEYNRKFLKAAAPETIKMLLEEEKAKVDLLADTFPSFANTIQSLGPTSPTTEVHFFKGKEGIKQMLWNELNAKQEIRSYVYRDFNSFVGQKFIEKWSEEFELRKLKSRQIRTKIYNKGFVDVKGLEVRHLSIKIFPLTHSMTIYNNVLAIYNWSFDEVYGVEICNPQVAELQSHFFDVFWTMAEK